MEPLDRSFNPKAILLIPWFILVVGLIAVSAWIVTPPLLSQIVFCLGITCLLATPHLFLYRLRLQTIDDAFVVSVRFFSATVYHRRTPGISWRPVATPSSQGDEPNFCRYRVDVLGSDGSRQIAIGSLLCFAFGVDCL